MSLEYGVDQCDFWHHSTADTLLNKENQRTLKLGQKETRHRQAQNTNPISCGRTADIKRKCFASFWCHQLSKLSWSLWKATSIISEYILISNGSKCAEMCRLPTVPIKINDKMYRSAPNYLSDDLCGEGNHDDVWNAHVLSFDCFPNYPKHLQDACQQKNTALFLTGMFKQ